MAMPPGLEATASRDLPGPTFAGAVHVAEVEVDPETGRVAVQRYAVVEDCGPVINPLIVEGQVHGAVVQGIGEALSERLVYDDGGQRHSGTLHGLRPAAGGDLPRSTSAIVETPSPLTRGRRQGRGGGRHRGRARRRRERGGRCRARAGRPRDRAADPGGDLAGGGRHGRWPRTRCRDPEADTAPSPRSTRR